MAIGLWQIQIPCRLHSIYIETERKHNFCPFQKNPSCSSYITRWCLRLHLIASDGVEYHEAHHMNCFFLLIVVAVHLGRFNPIVLITLVERKQGIEKKKEKHEDGKNSSVNPNRKLTITQQNTYANKVNVARNSTDFSYGFYLYSKKWNIRDHLRCVFHTHVELQIT